MFSCREHGPKPLAAVAVRGAVDIEYSPAQHHGVSLVLGHHSRWTEWLPPAARSGVSVLYRDLNLMHTSGLLNLPLLLAVWLFRMSTVGVLCSQVLWVEVSTVYWVCHVYTCSLLATTAK